MRALDTDVLVQAEIVTSRVHIVALCLEHGVSELVTGDGDFARFPQIRTFNPFT